MLMFDIPFGTTDWDDVKRTEHPGETGKAFWRTKNFNNIRVRMVEYTPVSYTHLTLPTNREV